ncbi:Short chain fatty acids transporter [Hyphomicrobiales bacterium]|nr:Short chain fatty acids transporter [Hyphomicrobiales bacterium]CAH1696883.1 Short chain fatty acids transporter [Hyphomicrobiales bacterium]
MPFIKSINLTYDAIMWLILVSGQSAESRAEMEKWFPDAFVFVLLAVLISFTGSLAIGAPVSSIVKAFGDGFWNLITFTLQASLVVIGGYVVASSPIATRAIRWLAGIPRSGPSAVAFVAAISCGSSLLNWAFSLIFGALLVKELARRHPHLDYRAASAAAILGVGSVWALGVSSAPAQLMANAASLPPALLQITGVIPFSQTIFLWQSMVMAGVLLTVTIAVAYFSAPRGSHAVTATSLGIDLNIKPVPTQKAERPGEWLECSRGLSLIIVCLGAAFLALTFAEMGFLKAISNLNIYNFLFLMLGLLLHGTPRSFTQSVSEAVPSVSGVLIQFPFYAGVAAILTHAAAPDGATLASAIAGAFTNVGRDLFDPAVAVYSAVLGIFIPSGGGKWLVEAPYVMQAAIDVKAHLGWTVQIYNAAEALPNLINPFWMIPVLGLVSLRPRDVVGFTFLQFLINAPLVLFMTWLFSKTLQYIPPVLP